MMTTAQETALKSQRSKILVAHFRSDIVSGAERSIADLAAEIQDHYAIQMLVPKEGNLAQHYRKQGFDVWVKEIQNFRRRYPGLHTVQSYLFARELKKHKIRVVLCNTFSAASRVGTACRYAHVPYAIYIREYISDSPLNRKILSQADRVFVISDDLQKHVAQMVDPRHIRLTYNHIDAESILKRASTHRQSGKRLTPFAPEHPVVGLVGRVAPFKQQDLFVRAIPKVLSAVPEARFVVVGAAQGKDLAYEASVRELAGSLGVQAHVAFMGHRTDNVEITTEMTVTCLTSTREPLGRVVLEGFILGVPVVATLSGGSDELVEDGVDGLKFDANAPDACEQLASQIIRLLKEPELRRTLANNAKEKVFATFASDAFVHEQARYIQDLIQANDSHR